MNPEIIRQTLGFNSSWSGADIGVAVVDSGIEPSDDFKDRISAFYDFTRGGVATPPYDDYGHGTHVAGTIGGQGTLSNSNQFSGIAYKTRLIGLKVLDSQGRGRTSDVIAAVEFAISTRTNWGSTSSTSLLAIRYMSRLRPIHSCKSSRRRSAAGSSSWSRQATTAPIP